ncbi:hypothetical protein ES705_17865 [subsurface metagenome]
MKIYFKLPKLLLLFTFFCVISCNKASGQRTEKFQIISEIKKEKSSPFYIDTEHYPVLNNLFGSDKNENSKFYISVPNPLLPENQIDEKNEFPYSYKYGRSVNKSLQFVKIVPFSNQWIDEEIRFRIKNSMPYTYEIIFKKK